MRLWHDTKIYIDGTIGHGGKEIYLFSIYAICKVSGTRMISRKKYDLFARSKNQQLKKYNGNQ